MRILESKKIFVSKHSIFVKEYNTCTATEIQTIVLLTM